MAIRRISEEDQNKSPDKLKEESNQGDFQLLKLSRPTIYLRDGDVVYVKLIPIPEDITDPGAKSPYYYRMDVHKFGPWIKQCVGDKCLNDETLASPCAQSMDLYKQIKPERKAFKEKMLAPEAARKFDILDKRARELKAQDWRFYLAVIYNPAFDKEGGRILGSDPCYSGCGGAKQMCPLAGNNRVVCPWESECQVGLRILPFRYIHEDQTEKNPGWLLFSCWNESAKYRNEIFNCSPGSDGNCPTRLIRISRRGSGMYDTSYKFKATDPVIIPAHVMSAIERQLGDNLMRDWIRAHLLTTHEALIEQTRKAGVEFAPPGQPGTFERPAGRVEERPAMGGFNPPSQPESQFETAPSDADTPPWAPENADAKIEAMINDPEEIYFEKVQGFEDPVPMCRGNYDPLKNKCKENGPCTIRDFCINFTAMRMKMQGGAPAASQSFTQPTPPPAPPAAPKVDPRAAAEALAKDKGVPVPRCLGNKTYHKPGKNPLCVECEKLHPEMVTYCGQIIAAQAS